MRHRVGGVVLSALAMATPAAAADVTIIQKDKQFAPQDIAILSGDTLVFVNADTVKHNVHSPTEGFVFDLSLQNPGQSDTVRITKAGVFEVLCHIHPKMKLTVRVTR